MISRIIQTEVNVICRSQRLRRQILLLHSNFILIPYWSTWSSRRHIECAFGSHHTTTTGNHRSQLRLLDFTESGKPENPEQNPQSMGDQLQQLYSHDEFQFDNQHRAAHNYACTCIYVGGHPFRYNPVRPRLTFELSGELTTPLSMLPKTLC